MPALRVIIAWLTVAVIIGGLQLASDTHSSFGYRFEAPDLLQVAVLLVIPGGLALLLPGQIKRVRDEVLWCLLILLVIPALCIATTNPTFTLEIRTLTAGICITGWLALAAFTLPSGRRVWHPPIKFSDRQYLALICLLSFTAVVVMVLQFNVDHLDLSFDDVYDRRTEFKETAGYVGLVAPWLSNVIAPTALVLGLYYRKPVAVGIGVFVELLLFSLAGTKSSMFLLVLVVGVYVAVRLAERGSRFPYFGALLVVSLAVPYAIVKVADSSELFGLFTYRAALLPAQLTQFYVQFTEFHAPLWFSHTFLRWLLPPSIDQPLPVVIGDIYNPGSGTYANANLWADGFVSAGWLGVLIASGIAAISILVFSALARGRPKAIVLPIALVSHFGLLNGAASTLLLSSGALVGMIIVWLIPTQDSEDNASVQPTVPLDQTIDTETEAQKSSGATAIEVDSQRASV